MPLFQGVTFDSTISINDIALRSGQNTLGRVTAIPESLIVDAQTLSTFTNTAGTQERGSTLNSFTLNWTYNRAPDPTSQSINNGIGSLAVNLRTRNVTSAGLTTTTTYTITAVGDDGTNSSLNTTISFLNRRYFGVSTSLLTTDSAIRAALTAEFISARAVTKTFDASVGGGNNYLYFAYPVSFGLPTQTLFGGFVFSDYTVVTIVSFTNASGFAEDFYVLRTNNQYNSSGLVWQLQ